MSRQSIDSAPWALVLTKTEPPSVTLAQRVQEVSDVATKCDNEAFFPSTLTRFLLFKRKGGGKKIPSPEAKNTFALVEHLMEH